MRAIHVTHRCVARHQSRSPRITCPLSTGLPDRSHLGSCACVSASSGLKAADDGLRTQTSRARHWRNGSVRAMARSHALCVAFRRSLMSLSSLCIALTLACFLCVSGRLESFCLSNRRQPARLVVAPSLPASNRVCGAITSGSSTLLARSRGAAQQRALNKPCAAKGPAASGRGNARRSRSPPAAQQPHTAAASASCSVAAHAPRNRAPQRRCQRTPHSARRQRSGAKL